MSKARGKKHTARVNSVYRNEPATTDLMVLIQNRLRQSLVANNIFTLACQHYQQELRLTPEQSRNMLVDPVFYTTLATSNPGFTRARRLISGLVGSAIETPSSELLHSIDDLVTSYLLFGFGVLSIRDDGSVACDTLPFLEYISVVDRSGVYKFNPHAQMFNGVDKIDFSKYTIAQLQFDSPYSMTLCAGIASYPFLFQQALYATNELMRDSHNSKPAVYLTDAPAQNILTKVMPSQDVNNVHNSVHVSHFQTLLDSVADSVSASLGSNSISAQDYATFERESYDMRYTCLRIPTRMALSSVGSLLQSDNNLSPQLLRLSEQIDSLFGVMPFDASREVKESEGTIRIQIEACKNTATRLARCICNALYEVSKEKACLERVVWTEASIKSAVDEVYAFSEEIVGGGLSARPRAASSTAKPRTTKSVK